MLLFSSQTAQRRIVPHCLKWVGLRALLLAVVTCGGFMENEMTRPAAPASGETVVLLHGMGRSRVSMMILAKRLRDAGYATVNFPYRTADKSLEEITNELREFVDAKVETDRYHLVTHSLGGVIARNSFKEAGMPEGLGRMVMLAPPNQPAELARTFKSNLIYRLITGESGQKLSCEDFYATLPIPPVEFGVIAGTRGQKISFAEPNDGIVSVAGTRLDGMKDFIELKHTHTLIMNNRDTTDAILNFLRDGAFTQSK